MVVAVKPGRFYGSSLPRPRIYTDVKLNKERVDPPMSVLEPFLSWANDAHWSMGGLSFKRHRLQGRIEGRIQKLRDAMDDHREEPKRKKAKTAPSPAAEEEPTCRNTRQRLAAALDSSSESEEDGEAERETGSDDDALGGGSGVKRKRARKPSDEFDKVASASTSPRAEKGGTKKSASVSPRVGKGEKKNSVSVSPPRAGKGGKKRSLLAERKVAVPSRVQTRRSVSGGETPTADLNGSGRRRSPRKTKHN
ncbi:hypothetical protein ACLOJK_015842 [Asimina triloba]